MLLAIQALVGERRLGAGGSRDAAGGHAWCRCMSDQRAGGRVPRRHQALWRASPRWTMSASPSRRGTLVTLLGPSGCGKTTHAAADRRAGAAERGRILIGGADVTTLSAAERNVSMVFQSYALFPHMTVLENVCYGLRAGGIARPRAERTMAAEKLAPGRVWPGTRRRLPSELSGGQQQRVAVARAIVLEPKVLLFDEPLSNLDAKLRRRVREEIRALQQNLSLTVVYVTHDQQEALAVSDRIIVMNMARIAQDGSPRALYERPGKSFRRRLHRRRQPVAGDDRAA